MTSAITTYRDDVIAYLKTMFQPVGGPLQLRKIEKHAGKFDEKEIMRLVTVTPAAYVAVLNVPGGHSAALEGGNFATGQSRFAVNMGVFIFTTHEAGFDADDMGWKIAEQIASVASNNNFGSQVAAWQPYKIEIENLWSRVTDDINACIMAIGWSTDIILGTDLDVIDLQVQNQTVASDTTFTQDITVALGNPPLFEPDRSIPLPYVFAAIGVSRVRLRGGAVGDVAP